MGTLEPPLHRPPIATTSPHASRENYHVGRTGKDRGHSPSLFAFHLGCPLPERCVCPVVCLPFLLAGGTVGWRGETCPFHQVGHAGPKLACSGSFIPKGGGGLKCYPERAFSSLPVRVCFTGHPLTGTALLISPAFALFLFTGLLLVRWQNCRIYLYRNLFCFHLFAYVLAEVLLPTLLLFLVLTFTLFSVFLNVA